MAKQTEQQTNKERKYSVQFDALSTMYLSTKADFGPFDYINQANRERGDF